jgi:type I restriction enzyme S subunit
VADFDGICSAHAMVLEEVVGKIIPGLLPFFMQSDMFMDRAVAISEGSLSPTIKWKTLAIQEFPLPPVERQEKIFGVLKKTSEVLFKCGGAITAAALAESALIAHLISNKNHNVSNTKVQTAVGYVSDDIPVYTISELIKSGAIVEIQDGNHGNAHPKAKDYVDRPGIPFIMARDIVEDKVDTANCKFLAKKHADSLRIGFSKPGDILLTHKGTVGLVAETPETFDYVMLTPQVTYYRIAKGGILNKEYLKILFKSKEFQRTIILQSSQSTRAYLSLTQQKKIKLPVPNISTQESIVNSYLTLHDNKKRLSKHQLRLSSLYQSLNCVLLNIGGTQ